jgi:RPA family protein
MNVREVAWRVFAGELNDSSLVVTGEEERAPTYVITPLGAKVNRVYVVGVITDLENVGSPEEPMWRAKIIDPTGTTYISAGQFQPEAALAMSKLTVPGFAAIIGKVRVYSPEEGVMYISIRPETVKAVDKATRDAWVLSGCVSLKQRLDAASEVAKMDDPSAEGLVKLGYSQNLADGMISAMAHYGEVPMDKYHTMLIDSLRYLIPEEGGSQELPEPKVVKEMEQPDEYDEFEESIDTPPRPPAMEPEPAPKEVNDEELTDAEEKLLNIINAEDPKAAGLDCSVLEKAAKKAGVKKEAFEEAFEGLLEKGLVYEPMLGKIRKI